jgi:hypothetical protein
MAKNKIDIQYPQSKNNTYESRAFTATENELLEKVTNNSDNPIGRDTIRAMQQKIMLVSMNSPVKKKSYPDLINSYKKSRWNNDGK